MCPNCRKWFLSPKFSLALCIHLILCTELKQPEGDKLRFGKLNEPGMQEIEGGPQPAKKSAPLAPPPNILSLEPLSLSPPPPPPPPKYSKPSLAYVIWMAL